MKTHHYLSYVILICLLFSYTQQASVKYQTIRNPFAYGNYQPQEAVKPVKKNKEVLNKKRSPNVKKSLNLHGIIQTQTGFVALINQKSMSIGDTVQGWKVISVDKNSVSLKKGTINKILKIK